MNKFRLIGLAIALLAPVVWQPAQAEMVVLGTASTGETVTLDTDSVSRDRPAGTGQFITATYYLDNGENRRFVSSSAAYGYNTWYIWILASE